MEETEANLTVAVRHCTIGKILLQYVPLQALPFLDAEVHLVLEVPGTVNVPLIKGLVIHIETTKKENRQFTIAKW